MRAHSLLAVVLAVLACAPREPLPVLAQLPPFQLTDPRGNSFDLGMLRGKVWVANFVFLGCSEVCPRLTARMRTLQERFATERGRVRLVTFSVDPSNDTPERLAGYAAAHEANPAGWTFLPGPDEDVERTVVKGFKVAMGRDLAPSPAGTAGKGEILQIFHGEHFVLVDGAGRIRGYYSADDPGLDRLVADARSLL